jgi:hypothetical protein
VQTLGNIREKHRETSNVSGFARNIFASREANFVHGWANRETFVETSRITNISTTMFPSAQGIPQPVVVVSHLAWAN